MLDEYLKNLRESGEQGRILADKIALLDRMIGNAMKNTTIMRTDGMVPFMAVFKETDMATLREVYLPVSTIVKQILDPILNAAMNFIASPEHKEDKTEYVSPTSHKPLNVDSYSEGMIDCLIGLGITFMNTLVETQNIINQTTGRNQPEEVAPSGDKDTDILSRASAIINSIKTIK